MNLRERWRGDMSQTVVSHFWIVRPSLKIDGKLNFKKENENRWEITLFKYFKGCQNAFVTLYTPALAR